MPATEMKDLSLEQQHAVEMGCDMNERIVGITGGAGTGKTSVLGIMYKELAEKHGANNISCVRLLVVQLNVFKS
jgi:ABC-type transporter Mla maintaining outer membrane lipid asymmetry ATPase subunit MlaF